MSVSSSFSVNLDSREFLDNISRLGSNLQDVIKAYMKEEALIWQREIRKKIVDNKSVVTGTLRRSITVRKLNDLSYFVGSESCKYAPYVEYGTRRGNRPKPYIRPVLEDRSEKFKSNLSKMVERALR